MFIPKKWIDDKPVIVTVQLPTAWMAEHFADWAAAAFAEEILANEGQRLEVAAGESKNAIVFTRARR